MATQMHVAIAIIAIRIAIAIIVAPAEIIILAQVTTIAIQAEAAVLDTIAVLAAVPPHHQEAADLLPEVILQAPVPDLRVAAEDNRSTPVYKC